MSRYTTEVRYICETSAGLDESVGYSNIELVIKKCLPKVFDFDFPIFDENYRSVLETKILRHYYTREIGLETVGLWKLKLNTKLNEIMPYYNKLYKSELLSFNPLFDVDLTRERKVNVSETRDTTSNANSNVDTTVTGSRDISTYVKNNTSSTDTGNNSEASNTKQRFSDTPQGGIAGLEADRYLTTATINDGTSNSNYSATNTGTLDGATNNNETNENNSNMSSDTSNTTNVDITNLEDYIETIKGKQGTQTYSSLLNEFRNTFLNIDMMIIDDLSGLFFGLWG